MQYFNNLRINLKFAIIVLIVFVLLFTALRSVFLNGINQFSDEVARTSFDEEASIIQGRMEEEEQSVIDDVHAVANLSQIADALDRNDIVQLEALLILNSTSFQFDDIDIVNIDGERLVSRTEEGNDFVGEDDLISYGLIGVETASLIIERNDSGEEINLLLSASAPIRNREGIIVGAVVGGRLIDDDFLARFNFERQDIHLGFVYDGQLLARYVGLDHHRSTEHADHSDDLILGDISIDSKLLDQALNGEIVYGDIQDNAEGIPHALGIVPVDIGNVPAAIIIEINLEDISAFQINTIRDIGGITIALVIASLLLIMLASTYFISRRLTMLQMVADEMTAGNYEQRVALTSADEIGKLAQSFNTMANAVQARQTELTELNATLEDRIKERTAKLEIATREALESTRLKDEFLSVMSHELRTPLNAIMGYQGIMKLVGDFDEETIEMIDRTLANGERLLNLINDVLDISRIEAGRLELIPSTIEIRKFVADLKAQMQVLADDKNLEFQVQVEDTVPATIHMDEDGLTKVITNLLSNAFKFTQKGLVSLRVGFDNNNLTIQVKDTGVGIPVHMQALVFEKFRQIDASSKREHGGSGLGLNIVQQYVQAMGGTISVFSELNNGAIFDVILPLEPVVEAVK